MNLRRTLMPVHRWAGLTLGLIAIALALTGAGMAFRNQLDPLVYPAMMAAPRCPTMLPLDRFADAARAQHKASALDYLRIKGEPTAPVAARFLNKDTLYYDRCTAQQVASQNRYAGVFGFMEWIHRGRWVPGGDWVMGSGALAMLFILVGAGVYLWWPRKPRRFAQGFTVSRKAKGPAFNIGLHRAVGGWVALPLAVSALTGMPQAFDVVHNTLNLLDRTHAAKQHSTIPPGAAQRVSLQTAWTTIIALSPNPQEVLIHVARAPKDPLEIYLIAADAPHPNARTYLNLDAYSGKVLSFAPYAQIGLGSRIYFWGLSIHTGEVGGIAGQCILFLGALGALVLGYTGISAYLRRRFFKQNKAPRNVSMDAESGGGSLA